MPMGKLLSINTISDILGISRSTVYQLIKRGELHRVHIRGRAFITSESLEAFQHNIRSVPALPSTTVVRQHQRKLPSESRWLRIEVENCEISIDGFKK